VSAAGWEAELASRHPCIFGTEITAEARPVIGPGWRALLETALARLDTALAGSPPDAFRILRIDAHTASIRFNWHSDGLSPATVFAIADAIERAEARSACTCERCGETGELHVDAHQFHVACDSHARGDRIPIESGWRTAHVSSRLVGGRIRLVTRRRYLRATDSFEESTSVEPNDG
jgi:hypothetical protein